MSTKPTTIPRWATDLTNNTAPSAGQQNTGWTLNQDGVSSYDNWFKYWAYKWFQWLDEGGVIFADLIVTGSTTYTGKVSMTLTSATVIDPAGSGNTDGIHTILCTPSGLSAHAILGIVAGEDGREIDILNTSDTVGFNLAHNSGSAAAGEKLRLPDNYQYANGSGYSILVPPRGSVKVRYHEADGFWDVIGLNGCMAYRVFNIPATAASIPTGATHSRGTSHISLNGAGRISLPITLPPRSILDKWNLYIKKNTDATNTVSGQLYSRSSTADAEVTQGSADNTSAVSPGYRTLTATPSYVFTDGSTQVWLDINNSGNTTPSQDLIVCADIFAWVPC